MLTRSWTIWGRWSLQLRLARYLKSCISTRRYSTAYLGRVSSRRLLLYRSWASTLVSKQIRNQFVGSTCSHFPRIYSKIDSSQWSCYQKSCTEFSKDSPIVRRKKSSSSIWWKTTAPQTNCVRPCGNFEDWRTGSCKVTQLKFRLWSGLPRLLSHSKAFCIGYRTARRS